MVCSRVFLPCGVLVCLLSVAPQQTSAAATPRGSRVKDSLQFVVVVARHGNRGGIKDYAQDPYPLSDATYWPYGSNGLTTYGRVQMYELGRKVRKLYDGFLNSTFHTRELRATSTATDRSLMSGQVFLAGLYPPQGYQVWHREVMWQPSPLYSDSPDNTEMINSCPKYVVDCDAGKKEFFKRYEKNISEIMGRHNAATGANHPNSMIWLLWDKLVSEDVEGYKLPEWTKPVYPEPFTSLMIQEYIAFYAGTDAIVRLLGGNLFGEIMEAMESKMNGSLADRRIQFYSGHDSTIVPLLAVLGTPREEFPLVKPGSAVILELHQDTSNQYSVQALYVDGSTPELEPRPLPTPVCGDPCLLPRLINTTQRYTKVNFAAECVDNTQAGAPHPYS